MCSIMEQKAQTGVAERSIKDGQEHIYIMQKERQDYEVLIEDCMFLFKKSRRIIDTSDEREMQRESLFLAHLRACCWSGKCSVMHIPSYTQPYNMTNHRIEMSARCLTMLRCCKLQKKKGKFQHSSFLAGGATSAAGRLVVENGTLKVYNAYAGNSFYIQFYH